MLREIRADKIGFNECCMKYQIPEPTLKHHVDGKVKRSIENNEPRIIIKGWMPALSSNVEQELIRHIQVLDDYFFGLSCDEVCKLACDMVKQDYLSNELNDANRKVGNKWFCVFRKRHPELSLWVPQGTSIAHMKRFNYKNIFGFFDKLEALIDEHKFNILTIFNVNETRVLTV